MLLVASRALHGQWHIGVALGEVSFRGASTDTSATTDPAELRPSRGLSVAVQLEHYWGPWGGELGVVSAGTGVQEESADFITIAKHAMHVYEFAPAASYALTDVFRLHVGPLFDIWKPEGAPDRTRIGALTAISAAWSFPAGFSVSLRAALALTSSPFRVDELPDRFDLRRMWRRSVAVGLAWQL